jgi:hypothetical protein
VPSPRDLKALIEAERTGMPFLHWRDGDGEQRILMLDPGCGRVAIGRREQSEIALTWDTEVSRTHALLEPVGEEWTVVDDGLSRNGSFVNGSRVHGRKRLHHRDTLCFGNTRVTFHGLTGHHSQTTARAPDSPAGVTITETQRRVLIALCRPVVEERSATSATNPQIASEVFLSVDAVKAHLRGLFDRFGYADLPQNEKRARLVATVLDSGILAPRDF